MYRKLTLFCGLAMATNCLADETKGLSIYKGETKTEYALTEIMSIKFAENNMLVNMKDGNTYSFPLSEITMMAFNDMETAIRNILANAEEGMEYTICDINGQILACGQKGVGDIAMPQERGLYIVKCGKTARKILVK